MLAPVTFGYDALNRRTNMTDAVGTTVWTYDALGRLAGERGPFGTNAVVVGYDEHGRMTSVVYGAYSARYSYDVKGRITGIQAPEGAYTLAYLSNGIKRTQVTYPNGVKETRGYDALTRMTNLVYKKWLTTLLSIDYRYDNGDRRTNEIWSTGRNLSYGYDRAHQLTDVTSPTRASDRASYRYDKAGNPIRRTEMGFGVTNSFNNLNQIVSGIWTGGAITVAGAVNYAAGTVTVAGVTGTIYADRTFDATNVAVTAGTNVLTAVYHGPAFTNTLMVATDKVTVVVGNAAYTHDANGNLTGDQNYTYQYDLANRLTNGILKASNVSVLAISYDGLGRRIQVVRNGTTTERYVYLPGSFLVLAILDGSNAVKEFYTHGPDLSGTVGGAGGIGGILSFRIGSTTYWLHADAMGNVILATEAQSKEVGQYRYSPFGRLVNQTGAFTPRFLYSSKEYDPESALLNFGYRHLNPQIGRWMERDRIFEKGGANLYNFVENSPTLVFDALGLTPIDVRVNRIERYLAIGDTGMAANEAYFLYLNLSTGGSLGSPFAAEMMDHWLGNTGAKKILSPSRVKSLVTDPEVSKQFHGFIKGVVPAVGGTVTKQCTTVTPKVNTGNYYALGTFTLCFSGDACPARSGGSLTLKGQWLVEDRYDWHAGLSVTVLGTVIKDDYALLVEQIGKAKPYDVEGSWSGRVRLP